MRHLIELTTACFLFLALAACESKSPKGSKEERPVANPMNPPSGNGGPEAGSPGAIKPDPPPGSIGCPLATSWSPQRDYLTNLYFSTREEKDEGKLLDERLEQLKLCEKELSLLRNGSRP